MGFGRETDSGAFAWPVWYSVSVADHLQSFCWPVLLIASKLFEGEEKFEMKR